MTPEQMMAVESKVANDGKSPLLAFVIWFFFGWLGAHRFYLNKEGGAFQALGVFGALIMTIAAASNNKAYVLAIFGGDNIFSYSNLDHCRCFFYIGMD